MDRAISLVELLLATGLIFLVAISTGSLYTTASDFFNTFSSQAEMQNQANIALQDMVGHIYLAQRVQLGGDASEITVWRSEASSFKYWQDGSEIKRGEEANNEVIAQGVKELAFTPLDANPPDTRYDTLQIDLTMQGKARLDDLEFVTKVALRKYE